MARGVFDMDIPVTSYPTPGQLMPGFHLTTSEGRRIGVSDYRGRRNLVLAFVDGPGCDPCRQILSGLAQSYPEFIAQEAEVLAVVQGSIREAGLVKRQDGLPFPVLADEDGQVHRAVGAQTVDGKPATVVYITDRFGKIYAVYRTGEGHPLPTPAEMLDWLRFIEIQCPE